MAELTASERLQPCLLDRLTDEDPTHQVESRDRRVFSLRQIRESVLRDLSWLLNAPGRFSSEEFADAPEVRSSVIAYGVPDLCGVAASGLDVGSLERELTAAVRAFEPRLTSNSLRVEAVARPDRFGGSALVFEIAGDLWAQPVPEPLYVRTEVDLESGQHAVEEHTPA